MKTPKKAVPNRLEQVQVTIINIESGTKEETP